MKERWSKLSSLVFAAMLCAARHRVRTGADLQCIAGAGLRRTFHAAEQAVNSWCDDVKLAA